MGFWRRIRNDVDMHRESHEERQDHIHRLEEELGFVVDAAGEAVREVIHTVFPSNHYQVFPNRFSRKSFIAQSVVAQSPPNSAGMGQLADHKEFIHTQEPLVLPWDEWNKAYEERVRGRLPA